MKVINLPCLAALFICLTSCQTSSTAPNVAPAPPAPYEGITAEQTGKKDSQWELQKWQYEQTKKLRGF